MINLWLTVSRIPSFGEKMTDLWSLSLRIKAQRKRAVFFFSFPSSHDLFNSMDNLWIIYE